MIDVGNLNEFGFRIGPNVVDRLMREVSIFVDGIELTSRDNSVYLPSFVGQLERTSRVLKQKIDYVRYEGLFRDLNVTQIHNLLLHGNRDVVPDERERWSVTEAHRFADWGETTDCFAAFLVPYCDCLYLTYQPNDGASPNYTVLDLVDGVITTPYYLIATIDEAVAMLEQAQQNHT